MPVERLDRPDRDDLRQDREKAKAVDLAFQQIEKQFGKGSIMRLGQKGAIQQIEAIPTGAISIDYALGIGGVPPGLGVLEGVSAGPAECEVPHSRSAPARRWCFGRRRVHGSARG